MHDKLKSVTTSMRVSAQFILAQHEPASELPTVVDKVEETAAHSPQLLS